HQQATTNQNVKKRPACSELRWAYCNHKATYFASYLTGGDCVPDDQNTVQPYCKKGSEKVHRQGKEKDNNWNIIQQPKITIAIGGWNNKPCDLGRQKHKTHM